MLPLAKIPSNCFFALVASAGFSKVMIATPVERPRSSYYLRLAANKVDRLTGLNQRIGIERGRNSWLGFFSK